MPAAAMEFNIGIKPVRQIGFLFGGPAQSANLGQAGQPGLERVAGPVAFVDFPEQLLASLRAERMRARTDDCHFALQYIEKLRQFVDARAPDEGVAMRTCWRSAIFLP